jgi:hypothetical protein
MTWLVILNLIQDPKADSSFGFRDFAQNDMACHPELDSGSLPKIYQPEMLKRVQHDV